MSRTDWNNIVSEKALVSEKNSRKKVYVTQKILATDLPQYVDDGWEKCKDYKTNKYVGIAKVKSALSQFQDSVWILFANMGFSSLNKSRLEIAYDFKDDELKFPVDVIAIDDETILIAICKAYEKLENCDFSEEISDYIDKIPGIRKEVLKAFPGRKIKFIWATNNCIITRNDISTLDKAGIALFNETVIEYYSDLSKHLGSCSRYQLLGNLFANQEIKNMDDRVPAIRGVMGGHTYYSFSIEPERLLKIGYVLHRSEANQNMMPTYQRIIKKKRLQEVRKFINNGGYFPNSIIINIDTNGKGLVFDKAPTKMDGMISKVGVLHIPKRYKSAYIIDGQHRLYGYSDSLYASTNTIPVVAFVDLARTEQVKLFMDINENQKSVSKTLRVTLNADMLWTSDDYSERRQALRSKIAQMLGEETTSPLYTRVVIGESESSPEKCITVEAIQSALKKCRFFTVYGKKNSVLKEGTFDCGDLQETCDLFYPFIEKCLSFFRDNCLSEWNRGDNDNGMLTINRGIQAVIRVIDDIVNMLIDKNMINPKKQSLDDMFDLIKYYLKPLADYLNAIKVDQRKELRGFFGGGADNRFWRAYQKAVADVRSDFCPEGLVEYWQNETKLYNEESLTMLNEIESRIKDIISQRLEDYFAGSWLVKGIPKNIYTKAKGEADEAVYQNIVNDDDDTEIPIWNYIRFDDCRAIILNGKNWSMFFEEIFVRPEESNIAGGREAKTEWLLRLNSIRSKMSKESYSVPVDDYEFIHSVYDWLSDLIVC